MGVTPLFGESGVDSLVNKSVENLRPVVWREVLNQMDNVLDLVLNNLRLVAWSADAVSIYGDLLR